MCTRQSDPLYWADGVRWAWIFGVTNGNSPARIRSLILKSRRTRQIRRGQYICKGDGVIFGKRRRPKR